MTIVLCSKGYPGKYKKNKIIKNIKNLRLSLKDFLFHAGKKIKNDQIVSNGGRVLNITSMGKSYFNIRKKIIFLIKRLSWRYGFYRKDIGWKVIKKNASY